MNTPEPVEESKPKPEPVTQSLPDIEIKQHEESLQALSNPQNNLAEEEETSKAIKIVYETSQVKIKDEDLSSSKQMAEESKQNVHQEEHGEDELEEKEDQVCELANNFKRMSLGKRNRIQIVQDSSLQTPAPAAASATQPTIVNLNESVAIVADSKPTNHELTPRKRPSLRRSSSTRKAMNADEEEEMSFAPRIERFLSICEIPPEVLMYTQQLADAKNASLKLEREKKAAAAAALGSSLARGGARSLKSRRNFISKNTTTPKNTEDRESIRRYHNGSGLTQAAKREIIKNIIRSFDLKNYLSEFKQSQIIEVNFDKSKPETRHVRDRLIGLMNSDIIRLNDRNYMKELANKVELNYKERQQRLLDNLEEQERRRQRKLKLKGLLDQEQEKQAIVNMQKQMIKCSSNDESAETTLSDKPNQRVSKSSSFTISNMNTPFRLPKLK